MVWYRIRHTYPINNMLTDENVNLVTAVINKIRKNDYHISF